MDETIFSAPSWRELLGGLPCCCEGGICARVYATSDASLAEVSLSCDECDNLLRIRRAPITAAWIQRGGQLHEHEPLAFAAPKLLLN
jgi:hypothetical protein